MPPPLRGLTKGSSILLRIVKGVRYCKCPAGEEKFLIAKSLGGCGDCGGSGRLGRYAYCGCERGQELKGIEDQEVAEQNALYDVQRRVMRWSLQSGLPARYEKFELGAPLPPEYVEGMRRRSADEKPVSWLLHGETGRGKTGLAVGYARQWVWGEGDPVRFTFRATPDLLEEIKDTFDHAAGGLKTSDVMDNFRTAELLLLDDIGAEKVTGWVEEKLYQIIGYRHSHNLPTLFTSNWSPVDLGQVLGERIVWRILELCGKDRVIYLKGPNLRAK